MNIKDILALVTRGIGIAEQVWENRDLALKAIAAVKNITSNPSPTAADIASTEADLDALLDEFNAPLPPDA